MKKKSAKSRMKKQRAKIKKVWRIFRFEARFELPDDVRFCRSGPLVYIRDYVGSGQDDESINYKRQIGACKASPNRHTLISVFSELREIAANHSRCYRGYLLDERYEPAGINKIAIWVGLKPAEAEKIIKELEEIGLIEQVPMPVFDPSVNEPPKAEKKGARRTSKKAGKSRASTRRHVSARARTSSNVTARSPFKNKDKSGSGNNKINNKTTGKPEPDKRKKKKQTKATGTGTCPGHRATPSSPATTP
jgi:hypothetical protein